MTGTAQEIAKIDPMSEIFRYVRIIKDGDQKPVDVKINESFLVIKSRWYFWLLDWWKRKSNFRNVADQDGSATMNEICSGVHKKISDGEEKPTYCKA